MPRCRPIQPERSNTDNSQSTEPKPRPSHLFQPGQSGNPAGRPEGSRHKIEEAFLKDFYEAWKEFGKSSLIANAQLDPAAFVRVAASLLPKAVEVKGEVTQYVIEVPAVMASSEEWERQHELTIQ